MKRYPSLLAITLTALMLMASVAYVVAKDKAAPSKGKEVTMTGTFSCTLCALVHPDRACPKGCCETCLKGGDIPIFTDKDGNQYVLTANEMKGAFMTPERQKMAGGNVKVKGMHIVGKGVQIIMVDTMEKVEEAPKVPK
jgi:hypothetical protein